MAKGPKNLRIIYIKTFYLLIAFLLVFGLPEFAQSETTEQELHDFSLFGSNSKSKKNWDCKASLANIFSDVVYMDNVNANMYNETDTLNIVGDKGRYDKQKSIMHLQENVVATTTTGARLRTDSLDWFSDSQLVKTDDRVIIDKENMVTTADGLRAKPDLKRIRLIKNVKVDIDQSKPGIETKLENLTTIICDGPLEIDYNQEIAIFNKNVFVTNKDSQMKADRMLVYFDFKNKKIDKIVARDNVWITRDGNISYSKRATYFADKKTLLLTGRPRIIIYSQDGLGDLTNAASGN